ncbi:MAG: inositol monophosphatase family protein [Cyanobacteria bacterium J06639_16]
MDFLSAEHLRVLHDLIVSAGDQAFEASKQSFEVFEKGVDDYVTNIDRQLDADLSKALRHHFPQDGVVSEENISSFQAFQSNYKRLWLIDPIDGTEDYIRHRPYYSVMVGLLQGYRPVAGWIYAPAFRQLYWGGPSQGLFQSHDNQAVSLHPQVPCASSEGAARIIIGDRDQKRFGSVIAAHLPSIQFYTLGSFGLKVLEVIQGRAGLYLYCNGRVKLWDTAGPLALALAAGLTCCDLEGNPLRFGPDAVAVKTLVHYQSIVIGWPAYVEAMLPQIRQAVAAVGLKAGTEYDTKPTV